MLEKYQKLILIMSYFKKNKPKKFCNPQYNILQEFGL